MDVCRRRENQNILKTSHYHVLSSLVTSSARIEQRGFWSSLNEEGANFLPLDKTPLKRKPTPIPLMLPARRHKDNHDEDAVTHGEYNEGCSSVVIPF